ncbi:MAG: SpaA isopeptide-forming pilin-related protein [Coriobacteriales bacterium]
MSTTLEKGDATVSIANAYTPATTSVTATKLWDDQSNSYGDRPEKVQFTLYAQPEDGERYQVSKDESDKAVANPADVKGDSKQNEWTTTWSNLPVYQKGEVGKTIAYTVEETAVAGYEKKEDGLSVTNTQDTTSLTATKTWGEDSANIGRDVAGVTIALQRSTDGSSWADLAEQKVDKADASQQVSWTSLPTHNADGKAYSYRAVEKSLDLAGGTSLAPSAAESGTVGGYDYAAATTYTAGSDEASRPGTGSYATTITDTPTSGSLEVTKTWSDDGNRDNLRAPVTATLSAKAGSADYGLGAIGLTQTLSTDGWDCTWNNLPVMDAAGNKLAYTVAEGDVPEGYEKTQGIDTHELAAGDTTSFSLVNTHIPGTISVTANKNWADQGNNTVFRPENVTYTLQMQHGGSADWTAADSKVLPKGVAATQNVDVADGAAGAASFTWDSLPAFYPGAVGDQVHYRVVEEPATGYTTTYDVSDITGTSSDADAGKAVTVTNTLDPVTYSFAKTDETGAPLAGTTLTLAGTFANADGTTTEETRTVLGGSATQDLTGNSLIKGASYTLEEATATDGYTYAKDATLTVDDDGSLSVGSTDGRTAVSADGHTVTVSDSPTQVTFKKIDRTDGSDIAKHMRYRVYALGRFAKLAQSSYVGDDGSIQPYDQPDAGLYLDGTAAQLTEALRGELVATKDAAKPVVYQLQEQEAPAGYQLEPTPVFFIVNPDGTATQVASATDVTPVENPIAGTSGSTLSFSDPRNIVSFSKQDAEGSELAPTTYRVAAASGSSFADGTLEKTVTTTGEADALAKLDSLLIVGDTYTVTETAAPAGYYLNGETLTFTVNPNGTMQFADADQLESYEGDGSSALVQKDAPIRFRIHKANAGEGDYDLSGATFSVAPVGTDAEPLTTEATDAAGDVDLSGLTLAADTDYTIAETKAPDGFKLDADEVTVHIDADGAVTVSGEAPASYTLNTADDGAYVLTCSDEPFVLQLLKTDPDGSALPDASFDVTGQFAGGSTSESVQTDAQGTAKLASLLMPGQTYTLTETAAPAGYQQLSGSAQFTMDEDGKLQVVDDAGGGVKANDEGTTLVVTDQRVVENGTARTGDRLPFGAAAGLLTAALIALFAHLANRRKEE